MGKHVYAAIDRDFDAFEVLRMREDRNAVAMRFLNGGLGDGQGQDCDIIPVLD